MQDERWTITTSGGANEETSEYQFIRAFDKADRLEWTLYPAEDGSSNPHDLVQTSYSPYGKPIALALPITGDLLVSNVEYDKYGKIVRIDYDDGFSDVYAYRPPSE